MIYTSFTKSGCFNTFADDIEPIFHVTLQTPSKTRERSISINPISDFTIGFASPEGKKISVKRLSRKVMRRLQQNNRSTSRWTKIERSYQKQTSDKNRRFNNKRGQNS